jgi:hypothetical protein
LFKPSLSCPALFVHAAHTNIAKTADGSPVSVRTVNTVNSNLVQEKNAAPLASDIFGMTKTVFNTDTVNVVAGDC